MLSACNFKHSRMFDHLIICPLSILLYYIREKEMMGVHLHTLAHTSAAFVSRLVTV